jgi:hypothetical protein
MKLLYKNIEDINALTDSPVKYSQFILLIKSLVEDIKLSNRPLLTLLKDYKKIFAILKCIKDFIFNPNYEPVPVFKGNTISNYLKKEEVDEMIDMTDKQAESKISVPTVLPTFFRETDDNIYKIGIDPVTVGNKPASYNEQGYIATPKGNNYHNNKKKK